MANGKGRTAAVTDLGNKLIEMLHGQRTRADTTSDRPERQMNRNEMLHGTSSDGPRRQMNGNASWPTDKDTPVTDLGGKRIEMLHGQRQRADTTSDRPGRHMNRNAACPTDKGGHQQ